MATSRVLDLLREEARALTAELDAINRAISALEGGSGEAAPTGQRRGRKPGPKPKAAVAVAAAAKPRRRRPAMTEEQRNAVSIRMKRYWASRRAAKDENTGEE